MKTLLPRIFIILIGSGLFAFFYKHSQEAVYQFNQPFFAPAIIIVPFLIGLFFELVPFNFKLKPSWRQFVVLFLFFCVAIFFFSLYIRVALPILVIFMGIMMGKSLVGSEI